MNTACAFVLFLLLLVSVSAGSHTLTGLATYIRENAFSASLMLDDITVGYYDSETKIYVARGNTTNEDDVIDPNIVRTVDENVLNHFQKISRRLRPVNETESYEVHQVVTFCEQSDNNLGQITTKTAYQGSTFDELHFFDGKFTYQLFSNYTEPEKIRNLERSKSRLENFYYPACIKMLKNYLKTRETQLNRKVKPLVRLIQKANSDSGGSRVSCLSSGFYPRHINLTLFRDGQPVSDHEITGGDRLPNADGTYQMRKSLEISAADKHKYTCSVTHLSLDNTLDNTLDFSEPFKSVILSVLIVLALVLVFGTGVVIYIYIRRKRRAAPKEHVETWYYDSETKIYVARGNTTNEEDVIDPSTIKDVGENVLNHFIERSRRLRPVNETESYVVHQVVTFCEQSDNNLGQITTKTAYQGSTFDELHFFDGKFTYQLFSNYTGPEKIRNLERSKSRLENFYYPACIKMLKNYLKTRETQLNRKVKPLVRLIQKANSDSGGSRVSCLASGFYPRHINLTLFRDGQPVSDHEITGGDLLPNADGTYQMRKSLEISAADKHKYTCSVTHLTLDNTLDVTLDFSESKNQSVILSVLIVLALVLVFGTGVIIYIRRKRRADSSRSDYSAAPPEEHTETTA
ncbi:uncharacterized protein LOC113072733 [Carassius auratus]|uniref:Uncharacterized protein LOC113072733 n=1 Tax=Carassius auratus TaxID=7957 RepID=A0A6P6MYV5_CARAU|nr:uncharacterized protein LOC113072733 [Carassius auratus]